MPDTVIRAFVPGVTVIFLPTTVTVVAACSSGCTYVIVTAGSEAIHIISLLLPARAVVTVYPPPLIIGIDIVALPVT